METIGLLGTVIGVLLVIVARLTYSRGYSDGAAFAYNSVWAEFPETKPEELLD